ncbi:hypothetical protein BaRGS_00011625, partial [Batillaria attramentaria]
MEAQLMTQLLSLKEDERVFLNGGQVDPPFHTHVANVTLDEDGFVTVETGCGVVVQFDGLFQARVTTPARFRHHLHGLCGNCDGNAENDVEVHGVPFFRFRSIEAGFRAIGKFNLVADDSDRPSESTA